MRTIITTFIFLAIMNNLNAQVAEIPFELKNSIILLEANINDNSTASRFVFDTGATSDLLDSSTATNLGLEANYNQKVAGAGGTKTYDIILSQKLTLNGKIEIDDTHLVLSDLSILKERLDRDFDGIIGYSLLKKYITKMDYENHKIVLYETIENADTNGYTKVPFKFGNGIPIPQFDVTITLRNGESFTGSILWDSGADLTLVINTPYAEKNNLISKVDKSLIDKAENLHGTSLHERIAIESININGYKLDELVVSLSHDKEGVSSYEDYLGILGGEIISKFNAILDYSSSILYLKPNSTFNEPFEFPLSGITLKKVADNIIIERVEQTSEAYQYGVRKGDQLISINNNSSKDIEVYRNLLKKEGERVSLTIVDTNGKTKKINIMLNRLL